jgi:GNAT superfamily N-acetyltransferase
MVFMAESERVARRVVRLARVADVPALVGLRAEMFRAMRTVGVEQDAWRASAANWFAAHVNDPQVCIVIVLSGQRAVSTAMAAIRDSVPSPTAPAGGDVLISNVCTLPDARGQGHGKAAFAAAMDWARATGLARAELLSTIDGRSMYEAAGFTATAYPAMRAPLSVEY